MNLHWREQRADWTSVLVIMYEHQMTVPPVSESEEEYSTHTITWDGTKKIMQIGSDISLTIENLWNAIDYLINMEFVEEYGDHPTSTFGLTQEGFQMAHQIKTERQRDRTNHILLVLTGILVVLTVALVI